MRKRLARNWPERPLLTERGDPEKPPRQASVLIPMYVRDRQLFTLFTKRTDHVEHHKGQISFPGGAREDHDQNAWQTAVRETEEEIGVPAESVRLLGALPKLVTVTDFEISPFVGAIPYPVEFRLAEGEVEKIIEIPVTFLLDPKVVEERPLRWKGKEVKTLVYHYHGHAIWGATAHILSDLLEVLR